MKAIKGFFKDDNDNYSMTRLLSFIIVVGGAVFAFIYPSDHVGYLGMITLGLGGKITQKRLSEMKSIKK